MATVKVGLLSGSLGQGSSNTAALWVVETHVRAQGHHAEWITGLDSVPPFAPQLDDDAPDEVASFRRQIEAVDAIVVAAPEYAGGVAGVIKNALDWLVGSASIYHKPVAVVSVGTTGGEYAKEQLVRTLSWQGALVVATLGVSSPRGKVDADGHFTDGATLSGLRSCVDRVGEALAADNASRVAMVRSVVEPLGIDVARFGDLS